MFTERLNMVLAEIGVSSAELARIAGYDRSNISRLCSGQRVPRQGGKAAWRLVDSICRCCETTGGTGALRALISAEDAQENELGRRLMAWLYQGMDSAEQKEEPEIRPSPYRSFGQKLSAVMELGELSNVRFGKLLSLDASYISRFRNGFRSPRSNPELMDTICSVLLDRILRQDKLEGLSVLMGISPDALRDPDGAFMLFRWWLYEQLEEDGSPVIERLLDNIEAFSPDDISVLPPLEETLDRQAMADDAAVYFGVGGLQAAVLRFLGNALEGTVPELFLYSDQNMDWMVRDPGFHRIWSALMLHCVHGGTRVHIVHTIDRDPSEMFEAISSWLPLYMTGKICSYYGVSQKNPRFSTTLFLSPGQACVAGSNVTGQEAQYGFYRYDTDPVLLQAHQKAYRDLLSDSKQLLYVYDAADAEKLSLTGSGGVTTLGHTLPLASMPESTLLAILDRCGVVGADRQTALDHWRWRSELEARNLEQGFVHACVPLADDDRLFAGRIPVDIPGLSLTYTPQEYGEHIRSILARLERHETYRLYPLPDPPFAGTQLVISREAVIVGRLNPPHLAFLFTHPAMCEAFIGYADRIKETFSQDRTSARRQLERYL